MSASMASKLKAVETSSALGGAARVMVVGLSAPLVGSIDVTGVATAAGFAGGAPVGLAGGAFVGLAGGVAVGFDGAGGCTTAGDGSAAGVAAAAAAATVDATAGVAVVAGAEGAPFVATCRERPKQW